MAHRDACWWARQVRRSSKRACGHFHAALLGCMAGQMKADGQQASPEQQHCSMQTQTRAASWPRIKPWWLQRFSVQLTCQRQ